MTDEAKRERVAKAIWGAHEWSGCNGSRWEIMADRYPHVYRQADAAIAAMEEPEQPSLVDEVAEAIWQADVYVAPHTPLKVQLDREQDLFRTRAKAAVTTIDRRLRKGSTDRLRSVRLGQPLEDDDMAMAVLRPLIEAVGE